MIDIAEGNFEVQKCISLGAWKEEELLAVAAGCESTSTHPIGNSIVEEAKKRFVELERPSKVEEISGKGIRAQMKLGEVLCGNRALLEMHHVNVQMMESDVYGTEVFVAINGELAGYLVIADTLKEDSVSAIRKMKKYGLRTAMLTGDAKTSADAIAKKAGVEEVYAQLLPEDKVEKLKEIRQKNGAVMFVGDGINDAPVLAGADVGAAMGSGADAAIEAADVVFMTSSMEAIPQSVAIAKATGATGATGAAGRNGTDGKDGKDGKDGVGIREVSLNDSGELIVALTDGTETNLGKITGEDGAPGVGISSVQVGENGMLTVTLSNGESVEAGAVFSAQEGKTVRTVSYITAAAAALAFLWLAVLTTLFAKSRRTAVHR